ncbi:MAG: GTPase HflX [Candidatus Gracilibacteria bacterium]|nr:GTPase HflX [Candidatus Gracilibacteria bacterium]
MKVVLVDIVPKETKPEDLKDRMDELENLVSTYGSLVVLTEIQKRETPDNHTYVGSGKLEEIKNIGEELDADVIIIGNILKSSQIYHINEYLKSTKSKLQAWDRVDLILKIFDLHAVSPEAKLQIELAAIKHMGPRIFGMGMELSRQGGGGSGAMRGLGETNTEIMKRHLREKEYKIMDKLEKYKQTRAQHRQGRLRKNLLTVGIVGYTNAGKSSLMNALTHKGVLSENKLFATLGTSVGKMFIETENGGHEILMNDTIGFIRDLPPKLIKAFSSTLEDSIESELLLHVVDSSDMKVGDKIKIVDDTLDQIGAKQERIYVFNKTDLITEEKQRELSKEFKDLKPIFISAENKTGFEELKDRLIEKLF